ncbi:hypothetical protein Cha6605_5049 [Chamaesiphon minutus PCC 6605]|uniref:Uncharacterized protein n=1 Tax=Chamaesiphon minutus (strain ATCC 27169 / PCC 6605) TaxID=1173020 RepID=K9ULH4_CHAP6|nr:hypothetical protein Cha6605_5049 [Chamaesiphon minutus PCC 6605]
MSVGSAHPTKLLLTAIVILAVNKSYLHEVGNVCGQCPLSKIISTQPTNY